MNKIEKEHLEAIEDTLKNKLSHPKIVNPNLAATSCAEITKEYAKKWELWKLKNVGEHGNDKDGLWYIYRRGIDEPKTFTQTWDLFINDLNEKG